jgi:hypothetical protein
MTKSALDGRSTDTNNNDNNCLSALQFQGILTMSVISCKNLRHYPEDHFGYRNLENVFKVTVFQLQSENWLSFSLRDPSVKDSRMCQ